VRVWLGGLSGDVLGAANELSRLAALHTGIVVWNAL
jgi:adenosylcobinamide-GDP ribazoletransferase